MGTASPPANAITRPPPGLLVMTFLASWGTWCLTFAIVAALLPFNAGVLVLLPVLLPIGVLIEMARSRTNPAWSFPWVCAVAAVFSLGACAFKLEFAFRPPSIQSPLVALWPPSFVVPGIFGAALIFWSFIWGLRRLTLLSAPKPQPVRCSTCAYDLSGLAPSALCPECGGAQRLVAVYVDPPSHPSRDWLVISNPRLRRALLLITIAVTVAGPSIYIVRWYLEMLPLRRRLAAIGSSEWYTLPTTMPAPDRSNTSGDGVIVRSAIHPERVLLVITPRKIAPNRPAVRIWLAAFGPLNGMKADAMQFPLKIDPPVICNLDSTQAEKVLTSGLPRDLVEAMYAAGERSSDGNLWIVWEDLDPVKATPVIVDPAPFLH